MSHEHIVNDSDKHFSIDPATREIVNESGKIVLVHGDHKSEQFTFTIPRYVDGHDMSQCNMVQVHYTNTEAGTGAVNEDVYETVDLGVSKESEDAVTFSWLITRNATQYVGSLSFSISYNCVADNGDIEYSWNTVDYTEISIKTRRNNSESVVTTYPDVLAKWRADTFQMVQDQIDEVVDGTAYVHRSGDTMTGNLDIPAPTAGAHAANKTYVDTKPIAVTLTAEGWSSTAPYTQTITVSGLSDAVHARAYPDIPDNDAEEAALAEETAKVTSCKRSGSTMTFRCREDKPALDIPVIVEVYV